MEFYHYQANSEELVLQKDTEDGDSKHLTQRLLTTYQYFCNFEVCLLNQSFFQGATEATAQLIEDGV